MLAFLSSLPISVLRILDTEANKFYDRSNQLYDAALHTRGYTQYAPRPYIASEINHKRHYIKVSFINRGMDFIDLHSIFRDSSVISSIPTYFQTSETAIICYRYNKPIRSIIFNFDSFAVSIKEKQDRLPTLYWLPKLHKRPYKARFIANSSSCTTTVLSKLLTMPYCC